VVVVVVVVSAGRVTSHGILRVVAAAVDGASDTLFELILGVFGDQSATESVSCWAPYQFVAWLAVRLVKKKKIPEAFSHSLLPCYVSKTAVGRYERQYPGDPSFFPFTLFSCSASVLVSSRRLHLTQTKHYERVGVVELKESKRGRRCCFFDRVDFPLIRWETYGLVPRGTVRANDLLGLWTMKKVDRFNKTISTRAWLLQDTTVCVKETYEVDGLGALWAAWTGSGDEARWHGWADDNESERER